MKMAKPVITLFFLIGYRGKSDTIFIYYDILVQYSTPLETKSTIILFVVEEKYVTSISDVTGCVYQLPTPTWFAIGFGPI